MIDDRVPSWASLIINPQTKIGIINKKILRSMVVATSALFCSLFTKGCFIAVEKIPKIRPANKAVLLENKAGREKSHFGDRDFLIAGSAIDISSLCITLPIKKLENVEQQLEITTAVIIKKTSFVAPLANWDAVLYRSKKIKRGNKKIRKDFTVRLNA
ncbi:MAG: hypothetical protein FJZ57_05575 [Chlamydiae bacterium]|nr:hypothetical protein [Chlamydiota bacterium]